MYKLKFFDGAFLTFFILCQTCTVQNACKNRAVGPRLQGGQSFPPKFWHKQKKHLLLQIALNNYLPPPPRFSDLPTALKKCRPCMKTSPRTHVLFLSKVHSFLDLTLIFFSGPQAKWIRQVISLESEIVKK